ncbi:MAG: hypothetical protein PHI97_25585 [Desulfobulbus sp.]|nr:hypothetical protein [Desulfobulbus sp.]
METKQMLEKKRALLGEIKQTTSALHRLPYVDGISREGWEARARAENIQARYGTDQSKWPRHIPGEYARACETAEKSAAAVKSAKAQKEQIESKLKSLQEQLATVTQQIPIKDLLQLESIYKDFSQKVEQLNGLIDEEEKCLAEKEQANGNSLPLLTKEKEDLLAAIACGESSDEDRLAALSLEIIKEEERQDDHVNALIASTQTIFGLKRKKEQLESELEVAKRNYTDGLNVFIDQELEKAGGEYVQCAKKAANAYLKVVALAAILEKCGAPKAIFGPYTRRFEIPSFILDSCMAQESPNSPGILFQRNGDETQGAIDAEMTRLLQLGIEVPGETTGTL